MQAAATFQHPNTRVNQMWPSITGGDLTGANLTKANLDGANLQGVNLTGANLSKAILNNGNTLSVPDANRWDFKKMIFR